MTSFTVNTYSYPSTFNSDYIFYLDDYTNLNVAENSVISLPLDLTCSISGSSPITYSFVSVDSNLIPSWAALNSSIPCLELSTPDVNTNTNFTFGVEATVNGYKYSKKIKLQIIDNPTPSIVTVAVYFLYSVAGLNIVLNTSMVLFNSASSSAIWMMINIYQIMLLHWTQKKVGHFKK